MLTYLLFDSILYLRKWVIYVSDSIPITPLEPPISIPSIPIIPAQPNPWDYTEIPNFYDRVRFSLNIGSLSVSNDVIDYFENAPMAENEMRKRVPTWRSLNAFKTSLFQSCIVYMTCYHLCPLISSQGKIVEQTTPSLTIKYATNNNNNGKPCERFLSLIDDLVSQILDEEPKFFFGFKTTKEYPECGYKQIWNGWSNNSTSAYIPLGSE